MDDSKKNNNATPPSQKNNGNYSPIVKGNSPKILSEAESFSPLKVFVTVGKSLEKAWKLIAKGCTHENLDLLIKTLTGIVIALVLPFVGNYFERQNYYNSVLSEYSKFLEEVLIEDRLYRAALSEYLSSENNEGSIAIDEIKNQIKGIARAHTEITLRTLSEDDSLKFFGKRLPFGWNPLPERNLERQKLLIHLLREAKLGFKDEYGRKPEAFLATFLEGIDLGRLGHCPEGSKDDDKCKGLKLDGIQLSRALLKKSNFTAASLNGAILDGADLYEARFIEAKLNDEAFLVGANLENAKLKDAELIGANLENANLKGADLTGADFTGADLTGAKEANLSNAILCNTTMQNGNVKNRDCEK